MSAARTATRTSAPALRPRPGDPADPALDDRPARADARAMQRIDLPAAHAAREPGAGDPAMRSPIPTPRGCVARPGQRRQAALRHRRASGYPRPRAGGPEVRPHPDAARSGASDRRAARALRVAGRPGPDAPDRTLRVARRRGRTNPPAALSTRPRMRDCHRSRPRDPTARADRASALPPTRRPGVADVQRCPARVPSDRPRRPRGPATRAGRHRRSARPAPHPCQRRARRRAAPAPHRRAHGRAVPGHGQGTSPREPVARPSRPRPAARRVPGLPGSPACPARLVQSREILRLSCIDWARVPLSTYSSSPPTGIPRAIRVQAMPRAASSSPR